VDPENCVSAHNLYVSILEIERLVMSGNHFVATLSGIIV